MVPNTILIIPPDHALVKEMKNPVRTKVEDLGIFDHPLQKDKLTLQLAILPKKIIAIDLLFDDQAHAVGLLRPIVITTKYIIYRTSPSPKLSKIDFIDIWNKYYPDIIQLLQQLIKKEETKRPDLTILNSLNKPSGKKNAPVDNITKKITNKIMIVMLLMASILSVGTILLYNYLAKQPATNQCTKQSDNKLTAITHHLSTSQVTIIKEIKEAVDSLSNLNYETLVLYKQHLDSINIEFHQLNLNYLQSKTKTGNLNEYE